MRRFYDTCIISDTAVEHCVTLLRNILNIKELQGGRLRSSPPSDAAFGGRGQKLKLLLAYKKLVDTSGRNWLFLPQLLPSPSKVVKVFNQRSRKSYGKVSPRVCSSRIANHSSVIFRKQWLNNLVYSGHRVIFMKNHLKKTMRCGQKPRKQLIKVLLWSNIQSVLFLMFITGINILQLQHKEDSTHFCKLNGSFACY